MKNWKSLGALIVIQKLNLIFEQQIQRVVKSVFYSPNNAQKSLFTDAESVNPAGIFSCNAPLNLLKIKSPFQNKQGILKDLDFYFISACLLALCMKLCAFAG